MDGQECAAAGLLRQEADSVVTAVPDRAVASVVTAAPDHVPDTGEALGARIREIADMETVVVAMAGTIADVVMDMVTAHDMNCHSISVILTIGITIRMVTMTTMGRIEDISSTIIIMADTNKIRLSRMNTPR